jgi:hypothetical protein
MLRAILGGLATTALVAAAPAYAAPDLTVTPERGHEAVVLTGKEFGRWAVPSNTTVRLPFMDLYDCGKIGQVPSDPTSGGAGDLAEIVDTEGCAHNNYVEPDADTASLQESGTPVGRLLGYRFNGKPGRKARFVQIPFQVDEQFTRYLNNQASGFSPYSGEDQHTTYAYDREGFRWTESDPENPCLAKPATPVAVDPIAGLDHNDELAFLARDAGPRAPKGAELPRGVDGVKEVRVADPTNAGAPKRFVYVMRAAEKGGPRPAFSARDGYVSYKRDANADTFEKSESSYDNYGNAARGIVCDEDGNVVGTDERRRPRDYATIKTDRYRFRYDGRWLMTRVEISPRDDGRSYGPDLVDRWKARAFQQDPASETPCCGYEEEDTNWGGSSTLLGERVGPVRAIRETWGADSGTNVIRRETFYRDQMVQRTWLRVHVIPPLDGIYAQWDFNAGQVTRFYNSTKTEGVPADGRNDEMFGNFDDPCNSNYDANGTGEIDQGYRTLYRQLQFCNSPYHQSVDMTDPTFNDVNAALGWSAVSGPNGTIVDRIKTTTDMPAGGAAQALVAVPYYRDDSCFDDGTGTDPGLKVKLRSGNEPRTRADGVTPRRCWTPADGIPAEGTDEFFQGSIATHGLHLLFLADSDNARMTVPTTEIISDWQMVMLPGDQGARGEAYGRSFERPLVGVVRPAKGRFTAAPEGDGRGDEDRDDDDRGGKRGR